MPDEDLAAQGDLASQLFTPQNMSCPHALWRQIRTECPVPKIHFAHMGQDGYLVSRKSDIEYVATHPEEFSSEVGAAVWRWGNDFGPDFADIFADGGYDTVHTIVSSDPPKAQTYRKIVLEALSPKRINARKDELQAFIDRLIVPMRAGETFDFRMAFAVPLPLLAISNVFGLPESDFDFIYRFSSEFLNLVDPTTPIPIARDNARTLVAAQKYLAPMIENYRVAPKDNFLSFIANARDDSGAQMSMEESLSIAIVTIVGGNETTRNALATAAYHLARDKPIWRALQADPSKVAQFAEEVVRFGSPATVTARQVARDTELAGTKMPKGAPVYMLWGSGSQDETFFDTPEEIRLDRANGRKHTSFGFGVHNCAGIHLARAELVLSIESWLRAFDSMDLAEPLDEIKYAPVWAIRMLEKLPLRITRR
jgi:cytochrome P450